MSEGQHTPGPWFIEGEQVMNATRSYTICMLGEMADEERANAVLITAAPELLELVWELVDADPCHYDHHGYCQAHHLSERPCPHERGKTLLNQFYPEVTS